MAHNKPILGRLKHMVVKEFIHTFRDPRMMNLIVLAPLIQLALFGYAVSANVWQAPIAILDRDNSVSSRDLIGRFTHTEYFNVIGYAASEAEAQDWMDHGRVRAVIVIDDGFQRELSAGRTAPVQFILDGADSNTASIIGSYAVRIAEQFSHEVLVERLSRAVGRHRDAGGAVMESRSWFNDNLDGRVFYVPGVLVSIVAVISLMLTSQAVVREKEIGTIEQIIATPISKTEFILGKTLPFAIISLCTVLLVTVVGVFWFEVPFRGSPSLLLLGVILYLMSTLGMGLLISTVSSTQQQAMMGAFFFIIPAMLLSGFVFPIANMPVIVQWLTYLNPLRYMMVIVRGIFLKGIGMDLLWPQFAALLTLGVISLAVATRAFRKTLA